MTPSYQQQASIASDAADIVNLWTDNPDSRAYRYHLLDRAYQRHGYDKFTAAINEYCSTLKANKELVA